MQGDVRETGSWLLAAVRMRQSLLVIPVIGLIASAGCASVQAHGTAADRPALMVPAPPPRLIEPAPESVAEPVPELPASPGTTPAPRPARSAPREAAPRPPAAEARPEPKAPIESVEPPPAPPAAQLRTPQTADTSGAAKNVRATIDAARGILNGVNYGPLSNERKKAYNDVKLFLDQAEDALKQGNLPFAQGVAGKAETLARELAGR